jgi:hypothetical protein
MRVADVAAGQDRCASRLVAPDLQHRGSISSTVLFVPGYSARR